MSRGERGVVECYAGPFHSIVYKGAGLRGYNEARYSDDPRRSHEEAHRLQNKKLIELALFGREGGVWKGTQRPRLLDVGCGNGELLEVAQSMGIDAVGITLIPEQVDECRRRGLAAYALNYRDIGVEWDGLFDGVVLKGCVEHFVQPSDVIAGRDAALYREMFEILRRVLNPMSPSGRAVNSTIEFVRPRPDPRGMSKIPFVHPRGSIAYHSAWLHQMYFGWHPIAGELEERAKPHFVLERAENISEDYRLTAEHCLRELKRAALTRPRFWLEALRSFISYPVRTMTHAFGLYVSQSTQWYFREPDPPAQAWLRTWKRV